MPPNQETEPPHPSRPHRRGLRLVLSYGVGVACLYWVFHDLNLRDVLLSLRETAWTWIVPSALLDLLVYVCAGWEWQILLRRAGHLSVLRTTQAVFAGRFANDVLPVHVGYLVRIYLVAHWLNLGFARIIPSLLIERLFDGLWLALGIGLTAMSFPLPANISRLAEAWAGMMLIGLVALAVIVLWPRPERSERRSEPSRWKWLRDARGFVSQILGEVRAVGRSWSLLGALLISILKLFLQALAFLVLVWAYGFHFPIRTQLAIFLIAYVGISVPSTPASVGVFQFFCVSGLELFGVPKAAATGFSLLAFVVLTLPLSLAGFFALAQSGMTLGQVRKEWGQWASAKNADC